MNRIRIFKTRKAQTGTAMGAKQIMAIVLSLLVLLAVIIYAIFKITSRHFALT